MPNALIFINSKKKYHGKLLQNTRPKIRRYFR